MQIMPRGKNFDKQEIQIFFDILKEYKVIESKQTDAIAVAQKAEAWEQLTAQFNLLSPNIFRSSSQLKILWKNLKSKSRANSYANGLRKNIQRTDVGYLHLDDISNISEQIDAFTSSTQYPLQNCFEDDVVELTGTDSTDIAENDFNDKFVHNEKCKNCVPVCADSCITQPSLELSDASFSEKQKNMFQKGIDELKKQLIAEEIKHTKDKHALEMEILNEELQIKKTLKRKHACEMEILDLQLQIKKAKLEMLKKQMLVQK